MNFKNFFLKEWADFGFSKPTSIYKKIDTHDKPMKSLDIEYIVKELKKVKLGTKILKKEDFFSTVTWQNNDGSISVNFSPFGGMRGTIKKEIKDLQGSKTWITEAVIRVWDYENPENIIEEITNSLKKIDKQNLPNPEKKYDRLEKLTLEIASRVNRHKGYTGKSIFMYNGIRIVDPNKKYIIMYDITGMGRQASGQTYVHQYQIFVEFDEEKGFIKITGNNLADKLAKWTWEYQPSEFLEYFSVSKPRKEIEECIVNLIRSY